MKIEVASTLHQKELCYDQSILVGAISFTLNARIKNFTYKYSGLNKRQNMLKCRDFNSDIHNRLKTMKKKLLNSLIKYM